MKRAKVMMMKIGKCKKELARIISEHGGWRDGYGFSAQDGDDGAVWFYDNAPVRSIGARWVTSGSGLGHCGIEDVAKLPNWHQTILSRGEYFHLYPAPDADGWIEWSGGECPVDGRSLVNYKMRDGGTCEDGEEASDLVWEHRLGGSDIIAYRPHKPEAKPEFCESVMRSIPEPIAKPTLDQLLQDWRNADDYAKRKQAEADGSAAMRDERWQAVQARAGEVGVTVGWCESAAEPAQAITDWCDLRVGDEMQCVVPQGGRVVTGSIGVIVEISGAEAYLDFPEQECYRYCRANFEGGDVKFIRRP